MADDVRRYNQRRLMKLIMDAIETKETASEVAKANVKSLLRLALLSEKRNYSVLLDTVCELLNEQNPDEREARDKMAIIEREFDKNWFSDVCDAHVPLFVGCVFDDNDTFPVKNYRTSSDKWKRVKKILSRLSYGKICDCDSELKTIAENEAASNDGKRKFFSSVHRVKYDGTFEIPENTENDTFLDPSPGPSSMYGDTTTTTTTTGGGDQAEPTGEPSIAANDRETTRGETSRGEKRKRDGRSFDRFNKRRPPCTSGGDAECAFADMYRRESVVNLKLVGNISEQYLHELLPNGRLPDWFNLACNEVFRMCCDDDAFLSSLDRTYPYKDAHPDYQRHNEKREVSLTTLRKLLSMIALFRPLIPEPVKAGRCEWRGLCLVRKLLDDHSFDCRNLLDVILMLDMALCLKPRNSNRVPDTNLFYPKLKSSTDKHRQQEKMVSSLSAFFASKTIRNFWIWLANAIDALLFRPNPLIIKKKAVLTEIRRLCAVVENNDYGNENAKKIDDKLRYAIDQLNSAAEMCTLPLDSDEFDSIFSLPSPHHVTLKGRRAIHRYPYLHNTLNEKLPQFTDPNDKRTVLSLIDCDPKVFAGKNNLLMMCLLPPWDLQFEECDNFTTDRSPCTCQHCLKGTFMDLWINANTYIAQ